MKKIIQVSIVIILSIIGMVAIAKIVDKNKSEKIIEDTKRFKNEYESLNNKSLDEIEYLKVNIDDNIRINYIEDNEIIDVLTNGSSIVFFGIKTDNNSRTILNILLESMKETYYTDISYINSATLLDEMVLDENNNVKVIKHGKKEYKSIKKILNEYLSPYEGLNDDSIKRMYVPAIVFIRDGEIVGFYDIKKIPISDDTKQIKQSILKGIHKVLNDICDESC